MADNTFEIVTFSDATAGGLKTKLDTWLADNSAALAIFPASLNIIESSGGTWYAVLMFKTPPPPPVP